MEQPKTPTKIELLKNFSEKLKGLVKLMEELPDSDDYIIQHKFNLNIETLKESSDPDFKYIFSPEGNLDNKMSEELDRLMKLFDKYGKAIVMQRMFLESEGKQLPPIEESKKTFSKAQVHQGKMHKVLGVKAGEKIEDKYKTGESLYNALSKRLSDHDKTMKMLNYAANISKEKDIFDAAVRYGKERKTDGDNS